MRRPWTVPVSVATVCAVIGGCSGAAGQSAESAGEFVQNGTFTMQLYKDVGTFDPYRSPYMLEFSSLAYDSLVNLRTNGKFVSGLAEKWTADAKTATFTLRDDVTCSDDTKLTATQVADAIGYVSNPTNGSPQYGYNTPTVPLSVTADDASRTVRVALSKPFGFLLNTIGLLPIVCAQGMKNPGMLATGSNGTGPFVLTKAVQGQSYTLDVREGYTWGPDGASTSAPGTPASIVMRVIENETTAVNLQLSGELNFTRIAGQERERLRGQNLQEVEAPATGAWLWFNQIGGRPTADKRVRTALAQAMDRDEVIKVLKSTTGGSATVSTGLIDTEPLACPGDTVENRLPKHDPAAAAALLDAAGWTTGADGMRSKNGVPLELTLHYYPAQAYFKPAGELIVRQWEAVGVRTEMKLDTVPGFTETMFSTSNYDVYESPFGFRLPSELVKYLSGTKPPDGTNISGVTNREYETLTAKARELVPPDACTFWQQAEHALWSNVDLLPIANRTVAYFLKGAKAEILYSFHLIPTSIRMVK